MGMTAAEAGELADTVTFNANMRREEQGLPPLPDARKERGRAKSAETEEKPVPVKLNPLTLNEFMALKLPLREWILESLIRARNTVMVHAWRGVGKSRFAHSLGYAIATGGKFLHWKAPKARGVLLVDGELTAPELQQRLKAVAGDAPSSAFRVLASDLYDLGLPNLSTSQGQQLIEEALGDSEVLILDNQSTLFRSGVENEAESWLPVQQWFLRLRRKGKTVVLIHHSGKGGEQRGTSRREDVLDLVLGLRRPNDYEAEEGARFEVRFEKARGLAGADTASFEARLEVDALGDPTWTVVPLEESRDAEVRELAGMGKSVRQIAMELKIGKSTVQRILAKCPTVPVPKRRDSGTPRGKGGTGRGTPAGQVRANPYLATKNGEAVRDTEWDSDENEGVPPYAE
jgi:AAA domain